MKKNIYLDYASTTPTDKRVVKAMEPYWAKYYGNPSSLYQLGLYSKEAINMSRQKISQIINCQADEIIFTGSGTESINLALKGTMNRVKKGHFITSSIEHHAVLHTADKLKKSGHTVSILAVNTEGLIKLSAVENAIKNNTRLISIMIANNEIGVIQDIQKVGALIEKINKTRSQKGLAKIYFHTDACQASGTLNLNVKKLHVDLLTINGSKIYGPKGVGILYIKTGTDIDSLIEGGGQEKNLRSGTENVPAIVGLAAALELASKTRVKENLRLSKLRDQLIKNILHTIPETILNGHPTKRLPNNINISILNVESESLVLYLDKLGIQVSSGSACTANTMDQSHVITALGHSNKTAHNSIRITLGKYTHKSDIPYIIKSLTSVVKKLR